MQTPTATAKATIKRVLYSIDESLPYPQFVEQYQQHASQIPQEIEHEGSRYRAADCTIIPALTGTMLYVIGYYEEIEEP